VVAKAAWNEIKLCVGNTVAIVDINSITKNWENKRDDSALNMIYAALL
jgi:hypothetical protein